MTASVLAARYHWHLPGNWEPAGLELVSLAGARLEARLDSLAPGLGLPWMNKYLSGVRFLRTSSAPPWVSRQRHSALPALLSGRLAPAVFLTPAFRSENQPLRWLLHELGHVWDIRTGILTPLGIVGGVADRLNLHLGGGLRRYPFACRFCDHSGLRLIPPASLWQPLTGYANNSTADYLADSFAWFILGGHPLPPGISEWLASRFLSQAP